MEARIIGVIEAEQTQEGKTLRNDRLLAVALKSGLYASMRNISDLSAKLVDQVEQFFVHYNFMRGPTFKPLARGGADAALALLKPARKTTRKRRR